MTYSAPLKDIHFVLNDLAGLGELSELPGFADATPDTAVAILEEAARFSSEILAPLNDAGDRTPAVLNSGYVTTTPGFSDAFRQFSMGGWQGLQHPVEFEGQGLPKLIAAACSEMLNAANMSFSLCPMLTDGAIEALLTAGSRRQKELYLPNLISGQWTGTMNLTEPQAGSDLSMVRTRAEPQHDGRYRIFGTKIFITWGDHDMAENIIHLVLARTPGAPSGVKGISLFVVPKFLVGTEGALGPRNDVTCASLEHKLGIKASPTAVLQFGESDGAIGELVGEENRGLEYMFVMMNAARFAVGLQGIALSDRAYQQAAAYAKERVQCRPVDGSTRDAVAIIRHPDVRRMLSMMRALTEAARALAYFAAAQADIGHRHEDSAVRVQKLALYEFLVPVIKGWSTEIAQDVTSLGLQVHGGMGYIEETGAAQYYRDARILPIYEGTTAIQANDLISRKTARDDGAVAYALIDEIKLTLGSLGQLSGRPYVSMKMQLERGVRAWESAMEFMLSNMQGDPKAVFAGAVPYLKLTGIVLGGWQMTRAMLVAAQRREMDHAFFDAKIATAQFFAEHVLPQATAFESAIVSAHSGEGVLALDDDQF